MVSLDVESTAFPEVVVSAPLSNCMAPVDSHPSLPSGRMASLLSGRSSVCPRLSSSRSETPLSVRAAICLVSLWSLPGGVPLVNVSVPMSSSLLIGPNFAFAACSHLLPLTLLSQTVWGPLWAEEFESKELVWLLYRESFHLDRVILLPFQMDRLKDLKWISLWKG